MFSLSSRTSARGKHVFIGKSQEIERDPAYWQSPIPEFVWNKKNKLLQIFLKTKKFFDFDLMIPWHEDIQNPLPERSKKQRMIQAAYKIKGAYFVQYKVGYIPKLRREG